MTTTTFDIAVTADDSKCEGANATYASVGYQSHSPTATTINATRTLSGGIYYIANLLLRWDTSTLANTIIGNAVLRMYITAVLNTTSENRSFLMDYFQWNGTSTDFIATAPSGTAIATTALTGITQSSYIDFALLDPNANISRTGYTSVRGHITGGQPTGDNQLWIASKDAATFTAPQLIVTHFRKMSGNITDIDEDPDGTSDGLKLVAPTP